MVTPTKCYCGAELIWVNDSRMGFKCGTVAQYWPRFQRWRVRRSLNCVIDHCWQHQKPFYKTSITQFAMEFVDSCIKIDIQRLPDNNGKPWTIDDLNRMKLWATPDRGIIVYGPDGLIRE